MRNASILGLLIVVLTSCSSPVPPTLRWGPSAPIDRGYTLFVTAKQSWTKFWGSDPFFAQQVARFERSLIYSDFNVTQKADEADYMLRVEIGLSRRTKPCGPTSNVRYILSDAGKRLLIINGRGPTLTCHPNLFDDMNRFLESFFDETGM